MGNPGSGDLKMAKKKTIDALAAVRCPNALEYFERKLAQKRSHIEAEEQRCAWMEIIIKELKGGR